MKNELKAIVKVKIRISFWDMLKLKFLGISLNKKSMTGKYGHYRSRLDYLK